ncbi:MAG: hypothetical protein ABJE47_11820 [bacterium]
MALVLHVASLVACKDKTTTAVCAPGQPSGVVAERAKAKCLAEPGLSQSAQSASTPHDVVLYLDRSASMQGFLDPDYPTRIKTDFRSVLDAIIAGLRPIEVHSYGSSIASASPSIGVLGRKEFYQDRDTKMEEVVALIGSDTGLGHVHLIVGDGRRGSPATADGQYVSLRDAAQRWIDGGGTFVVATSNAPFKTVESDPSGCRRSGQQAADSQTCPIYLFAFVPHGDAMRIASAITDAFEHMFMWPAPTVPSNVLDFRSGDRNSKLNVNAIWEHASDGTPIVRTGAAQRTLKTTPFAFGVKDTTTALGRAYAKIQQGEENSVLLTSRSIVGGAAQLWQPAGIGSEGLVRSSAPSSFEISSLGTSAPASIVRVDVVPTGVPTWLSAVEASDARDVVRTYGIGRLFESFRQRAKQTSPTPLSRLYIVSN